MIEKGQEKAHTVLCLVMRIRFPKKKTVTLVIENLIVKTFQKSDYGTNLNRVCCRIEAGTISYSIRNICSHNVIDARTALPNGILSVARYGPKMLKRVHFIWINATVGVTCGSRIWLAV